MIHDTLFQRYPQHGRDWLTARLSRAQHQLRDLPEHDPRRWPLVDDQAVALDRLGRADEGVPLLYQKLQQQKEAGLQGRELYTSFANLGTLLIHGNMQRAFQNDPVAIQNVEEGLGLIRQAVDVHPQAHFGREFWQVKIVEYLLKAVRNPKILTQQDFVGNRLNVSIAKLLDSQQSSMAMLYGRTTHADFTRHHGSDYAAPDFYDPAIDPTAPENFERAKGIRQYVTEVGYEVHDQSQEPVPFDEPVLGIIGMWQEGGGPNPHFALAIGEIMLRVGQRFIAWNAFERASRMADRYSPDPHLQKFLREHCEKRQSEIEETIRFVADAESKINSRERAPWQYMSGRPDPAAADHLRADFAAEFAAGTVYQKRYQEFESAGLASGQDVHSPTFFDEFHQQHSIASPPGMEESVLLVLPEARRKYQAQDLKNSAIFGAGIGAMFASMLQWNFHLRRRRRTAKKQ